MIILGIDAGVEGAVAALDGRTGELIGVREIAEAASAVTGKKIEVTTAAPGASPPQRFGPSLSVTSNHVEQLTGRPATSLRALYEANKSALLGST